MIRKPKLTLWIIAVAGIIVILFQVLIIWFSGQQKELSSFVNIYYFTNILTPILTVALLMLTFQSQRKQLNEQRIQTAIAKQAQEKAERQLMLGQIEERFFTFLRIHRDNGESMTFRDEKGKRVFIEIFKKFEDLYKIIQTILRKLDDSGKLKAFLSKAKKIELTYLLVFYGFSGENSTRMLEASLKDFDKYLKENSTTFAAVILKELSYYKIAADGFQANLGHYFRHLFQTVIYIHNQNILSPDEKKFYLKRLRAQFSNHEIAILFVNSFSLGKRWVSYHSKDQPKRTDLISEYRLIQNLPPNFFANFDFRCFFPNIRYEGESRVFVKTEEYKTCNS